ncbi:MAG: methyltransferase domain-containing protein [Myxococcota bacterium]
MGEHTHTLDELRDGRGIVVTIEGYGFTGEGFVRIEDGWLSVRGAMPGERVRVRVEPGQPQRTRRLFAEVLDVLEESPERRDAMCTHARRCRGCHIRHVSVEEEQRFKASAVRETLERYAGLEPDEIPEVRTIAAAPAERGDAERIRSALTYTRRDERVQLGLVVPGSDELVPMAECPALASSAQRCIARVATALEECAPSAPSGAGGLRAVRVAAPEHGRGFVVLVGDAHTSKEALQEVAQAVGVRVGESVGVFTQRGGEPEHVMGPERTRLELAGVSVEVTPRDWFHATLRPAQALYEELLSALQLHEEHALLDAGCGAGTIGLMCAPYVRAVWGFDVERGRVERATYNAARSRFGHVEFVAGSWEGALRRATVDGRRFERATINPMREPLGRRAMAMVDALVTERLVYLGPSPVSTARDVGVLVELGWGVEQAAAANLHPATYHVMSVVTMVRRA